MNHTFAQPQIPANLLHDMKQVEAGGEYDKKNRGQWVPAATRTKPFKGVVMPLNNEDLQYTPYGTHTVNAQKLYTNGKALAVGARVIDLYDKQEYTVKQELTHGPIHPMKRYVVERRGEAAPR